MWTVLRNELAADPLGRGYAGMSDQQVAASLNVANRVRLRQRFITARTLLAELGPESTAAILGAIEAAAAGNPVLSLVLPWLKSPESEGIDIGHANTQAMIDQLAADGVLAANHAASVKAMGTETVSRAVELGIAEYHAGDIAFVRSTM